MNNSRTKVEPPSRGGDRSGAPRCALSGPQAEALAGEHLQELGYRIVERGYRFGRWEIDLIAYDQEVLCFVEVKARSSTEFGGPFGALGGAQRTRIRRAAQAYLAQHWPAGNVPPCRLDAVMVSSEGPQPTIELVRDAF